MKYSDLPNITRVPYIQVNGCEDEEDAWPVIDDGYIAPGLTRQGSVSCEVLSFMDETQRNMKTDEPSPYVQVSANGIGTPGTTSRSRGISRDGEYVTLRPVAKKNKATSLDKDPEDDEYGDEAPRQGFTDVALRKYADERKSGVPSRVYQVLYDFATNGMDELKLNAGDTVTCIMDNTGEPGWFYGEAQDGKMGFFPESFVKFLGSGPRQVRMSQVSFDNKDMEECLLGRGGCAEVYQVSYNGGMAALKVFRKTGAKLSATEAVRQEAILINRLTHPNIIKLYGMCLDAPNVGLLLELCEGRALKNMLTHVEKTNTFVSVRFMVDWAVQVATAMEFLIMQDILHRDLKAENVLVKERVCYCDCSYDYEICPVCCGHTVRARLTLKITDFGTTKERIEQDDKRMSNHVVGTYSWMAPEAFRLHKYTEASDVWSFGVVLWEILTRKVPYEGVGPIIAAFNVVKNGSMLEVDNYCPDRWKVIMKGCWDTDPQLRPTFSQIKNDLLKYKQDLEADDVTVEEEERVEMTQKEIMEIITNFRDNPHVTNEYTTYYEKLYKKIDDFMIGNKREQHEEPKTKVPPVKPRRKNYKNIKKADIGAPMDTRHMASIRPARPTSTSPHQSGHLQIILSDKLSPSSSAPAQVQDYAGTLPRIPRKPVEKEAHPTLGNALSISSPNLNNITDGNSTLRRKDAIKRKNKNLVPSPNHGGTETPPKDFASISVADPAKFVEALATPVRRPSKDHNNKLVETVMKNDEDTPKEHKSRFNRIITTPISRLFRHRNSRSIEDSGEESPLATTPSYSARSSTSSTKGSVLYAHMGRGPTPLDSYQRQHSRPRVSSHTFASDEENFMSTGRRNKISPSEDSRTASMSSFAPQKPTSLSHLENFHPKQRPMGIDDTLPSPSEIYGAMEYQQQRGMSHYRTPSDEVRFTPLPEFPRNTPTMSPPSHVAPKLDLELSTVIPTADASYPEDNPYVQCPPIPQGHNAVNNAPYIQMPTKTIFQGVTNDQYFNCTTRPIERPDTLPLKTAATPESSGISTGGSSAFSSLSMFNEAAPTIQAPPPPMLPRAPPAIPPREGSVGLPQFAS